MGQLPFSGNYRDRITVLWSWDGGWWVSCGRGHQHRGKSHGGAEAPLGQGSSSPSHHLPLPCRQGPVAGSDASWGPRLVCPTVRKVKPALELNGTWELVRPLPGLEHGPLGKRWRSPRQMAVDVELRPLLPRTRCCFKRRL